MNSQSTQDRADADLRALLAQADPLAGTQLQAPEELLARIHGEIAQGPLADRHAQSGQGIGPGGDVPRRNWPRRHWQGLLLAAASVVTVALAAGVMFPILLSTYSGTSADATSREATVSEVAPAAPGDASALMPEQSNAGADAAVKSSGATAGDTAPAATGTDVATAQLARSASVLVGTDDIAAQRDAFVTEILAMGGRVMGESTITTADSASGGVARSSSTEIYPEPGVALDSTSSSSYPGSYPYSWYPTGPGVWLSVEVPVAQYDRAIEAARATGEVVRLVQSSNDVGTQMADIDGRIAALESSLARLTSLMGQATSVSDVIALEEAISQRQAELDSLRAQQAELANQTAMSRVALTLMSVADANASVSPPTSGTWWDAFGDGLGQLWLWFGKALLIVSPLLVAAAIIAWVRRRHHRSTLAGTEPGSRETMPPNPA